jgi:hypothetical protein
MRIKPDDIGVLSYREQVSKHFSIPVFLWVCSDELAYLDLDW